MNIGLLITRFPPDIVGGAELQIKQVAYQLARRGHHVTVFTRRYQGRPFVEQQDGYRICRRRELPVPLVRMIWDTFPALWDIQRHRPRLQVLLCYQTLNSGFIGAVAQTMLRIPAIVSLRSNKEYLLYHSMANRALVPSIYRRAKRLIVQSPRIQDDLHTQLEMAGKSRLYDTIHERITVIPNGIDLADRQRSRGKAIVYVGRLIKNKGIADLIMAMKHLPGSQAVVVGDGPDRERLEGLAEGLPVSFTGWVAPSDVTNYLNQARLLVLPSHLGDGLPNVILEAMSCGVPVVTTRTAGMPDLVRHEETGLLFEPGNVQQLTRHVARLLNDDDLWGRLGDRSIEVIKSYSWEVVAPQIEAILHDVSQNGAVNGN